MNMPKQIVVSKYLYFYSLDKIIGKNTKEVQYCDINGINITSFLYEGKYLDKYLNKR